MGASVLSPSEASLILFGVFFALMALRVPIAFGLQAVQLVFDLFGSLASQPHEP